MKKRKRQQFTIEKRMILYWLLLARKNKKQIMAMLEIWRTALEGELKRGTKDWKYLPYHAQQIHDQWRKNNATSRVKLLQNNSRLWYLSLLEKWAMSPDALAWRLKKEWKSFICTKTLYAFINNYAQSYKKQLLHGDKPYKKHHSRIGKKPLWYRHISERPLEATLRSERWHMEVDMVMSKGNKNWGLVTIVDRKLRYLIIEKSSSKKITEVNSAVIRWLKKIRNTKKLKTITSDNGHEFFWYRALEKKLTIFHYFADPFSSRQRWTNEQHNKQIRVFIPKKTDISLLAIEDIKKIQLKINMKPRKILWYSTPYELFHDLSLSLF
jgi:IS30 family transposase